MKRMWKTLMLCSAFAVTVVHAQDSFHATPILTNGTTAINLSTKIGKVVVEITTHQIQNGTPSNINTAATKFTSCTNSRVPCSVVDSIAIAVNGKSIFVPRSVYCDLADLDRGTVLVENGRMSLMLWVGDAAEAYIGRIDFDEMRVTRRRLSDDVEQRELLQDTTYYVQSFDR